MNLEDNVDYKEDIHITFITNEYTVEDTFIKSKYEIIKFSEADKSYWLIRRNDSDYLSLSSGYTLLKTKLCGICSTDLQRRFLPFPLPQVTGHEIVAESLNGESNYVVEISDSCISHEDKILEVFCKNGLRSHCNNRYVIGINMLPGGFSPYILVPNKAMIKYNREIVPDYTAILVEPLAAAFNAISTSPPLNKDNVAVIGVKKLGSLLVAALNAYRRRMNLDYKITAIVRREEMFDFCFKMGADQVLNSQNEIESKFDVIYDTSGSESGFKFALKSAKREVHLKSTSGLTMCSLNNLTAMVVDEISISSFESFNKKYEEDSSLWKNKVIYISPKINIDKEFFKSNNALVYSKELNAIEPSIFSDEVLFPNSRLPRFDFCIVSSIEEIDKIIRPFKHLETSLVSPRGFIIYKDKDTDSSIENNNEVIQFISNSGFIRTSRCGDFEFTIDYLENDANLRETISSMIEVYSIDKIEAAFKQAKSENSIKVVIKHNI